jgi:homoserine O-acetyltransferase
VGEGSALDPADWFIVCANMLGGCQGTTGPSSTAPDGRPWGSRFPRITIRDQVEAERRLADHLGVARWAAVLGGSMGGMRVLEWMTTHPERVDAALVLAVGARAHADQIGPTTPRSRRSRVIGTGRAGTTTAPAARRTPAWGSLGAWPS